MQKLFKKNHKKIGLLGGTFDPPHIGHIKISREAKKKFKLDYIIWAVTKKNPLKKQSSLNLKSRINFAKKIDIYFIMGADNLINFHKWHKWKSISKKCNILVFDRQGYRAKSLKSITYKQLNKRSLSFIKFKKVNISSSQLRRI